LQLSSGSPRGDGAEDFRSVDTSALGRKTSHFWTSDGTWFLALSVLTAVKQIQQPPTISTMRPGDDEEKRRELRKTKSRKVVVDLYDLNNGR
jgi:hypothetical protein